MRFFKLFLLVFLFSPAGIFCDTLVVDGNVTYCVSCSDVNSARFINEYGNWEYVHEITNRNYHAFEITVKKDDGVFDKYCLLVAGHKISALKSSLTNRAALQSVHPDYDALIWTRGETDGLFARFPKIKEALDLQIESMIKTFPKEYHGYLKNNISFYIQDIKSFDNSTYIIFTFDEGHSEFGGVLYVLNSGGEIITKKTLSERNSESSLSEAVILSKDKILLFNSMKGSLTTRIELFDNYSG